MTEAESINAHFTKYKYGRMYKDAHTRYVNETTEATMLHTKSVSVSETKKWAGQLKHTGRSFSKLGMEFPPDKGLGDGKVSVKFDGNSYFANCFPVEKVDNYWVSKLRETMNNNKI